MGMMFPEHACVHSCYHLSNVAPTNIILVTLQKQYLAKYRIEEIVVSIHSTSTVPLTQGVCNMLNY